MKQSVLNNSQLANLVKGLSHCNIPSKELLYRLAQKVNASPEFLIGVVELTAKGFSHSLN